MKAKILRITDTALWDMVRPGFHRAYVSIEDQLPEDGRITGMQVDFRYPSELWLRIESETFPEVEPGCMLECLRSPVFRTLEK